MKNCIKFLFSTILLTFLSIMTVTAAPLSEIPVILEQPNGETIECYANGDEFFSYLTDKNGNVIIKDDSTGYYTYAQIINEELMPGNIVLGPQNLSLLQNGTSSSHVTIENIPTGYIESIRNLNSILNTPKTRMKSSVFSNELEPNNPSPYYNKTVHNIVIFISFSNSNFSTKTFNKYNEVFNTGLKSLKTYYDEVSYGRTHIETAFCPKPTSSTIISYKAPNTRNYYLNPGQNRIEKEYSLLKGALEWAINNNYIPNDVDLDVNNDGDVDAITFVVAGNVDTSDDPIFWPHQWNFWSISDNVDDIPTFKDLNFYNFSVNMEGALMGSTVGNLYQTYAASLYHETFHMVFNGPDLYYGYRTLNTNNGAVGNWDIMCSSNGGHMNSYLKYKYGQWINIPEITKSGRYTLNPITQNENNSYFIRSPYKANEYFVLEYRKKGMNNNFEYNIPNSGLIIYRINDLYWGNYYSGTYWDGDTEEQKEEVYVYRQNPTTSTQETDVNSAHLVNKSSNVILKFRKSGNISKNSPVVNGKDAGITISNISSASDTISFNVTLTTELQYGFRDVRIIEEIAKQVGKTPSTLTQADFERITSLSLPNCYDSIPFDLTGIEKCINLTNFKAQNSGIIDISPLASLKQLTSLDLRENNITNISSLTELTSLRTLQLRGNLITDYTPVQSYYESLTTKDFSLYNNNIILRTLSYDHITNIPQVICDLPVIKPSKLYISYELINELGDVIKQELEDCMPSGTYVNLSLPDGFNCNEGKSIRIIAYERKDYKQKLCSLLIKPSVFDLSM